MHFLIEVKSGKFNHALSNGFPDWNDLGNWHQCANTEITDKPWQITEVFKGQKTAVATIIA
jgi:hypothetical protein